MALTVEPFSRDDPATRMLVADAVAGSHEAFSELVARHQDVVFRTALAALGRREDAEEAAQEAFLVAWRKLPGFRGTASFRTWLLTITWRKALDRRRIRAMWWRRSTPGHDVGHLTPEDFASAEPTPEHRALSSSLANQTAREIRRLSPKLRDALLLAASGEYAYVEIADMLGVPVGTVKWRVAEARRILVGRLQPAAPGGVE